MASYYNEFDPFAAAWLRELIKAGHVAPGDVDERSIEDVTPDDLRGYTQCHFFAGIGGWSYAARLAGIPDDFAFWSGSCPCQPFSAAGKGAGFADERHLWPAFFHLIGECRPAIVVGEQVASKDGLQWLDAVQADLEASGYASGAVDLCAAGVGAPHIRQRLWWVGERVAHASGAGRGQAGRDPAGHRETHEGWPGDRAGDGSAHDERARLDGLEHATRDGRVERRAEPSGRGTAGGCGDGGVADAARLAGPQVAEGHDAIDGQRTPVGRGPEQPARARTDGRDRNGDHRAGRGGIDTARTVAGMEGARPTNGLWRDADWLFCRDGKWRPVEPGTFPLVAGISKGMVRGGDHGASINADQTAEARVGRLRGYGNAIVPHVAAVFLEAALGVMP